MNAPDNSRQLPDPEVEPTISVDRLAKVLHLSKASTYNAIHAGEIPAIRVGHRIVVSTAAIRRMLDLDNPAPLGDVRVSTIAERAVS